eukprot:TRINITY_DN4338_c0_g2_i1.p2 TRINITY_DN4338_c0_g2~~TRINITY_DN4338_c0_g2_i1.p2  ORF type:complete len:532 (+),score=207.71 TRINITY_DN4338_c0_g2_i1:191-1786(+)
MPEHEWADAAPLIVTGGVSLAIFTGSVWYWTRLHASYNFHRNLTVGLGVVSLFLGSSQLLVLTLLDLYDVRYQGGSYSSALRQIYNGADIACLALFCIVLPFMYAFDSDKFTQWRSGDRDNLTGWKVLVSCLFVVPPAICVAALFSLSYIIANNRDSNMGDDDTLAPYRNAVTADSNDPEEALRSLVAAMGLLGLPFLCYYLPNGFGMLTAGFFTRQRTRDQIAVDADLLADEIEETDEAMRAIKKKYMSNLKLPPSKDDKRSFEECKRQKADLESARLVLGDEAPQMPLWQWVACRAAGVLVAGTILLFCASTASGVLYKVSTSACGVQCGFLTRSEVGWYNPLDKILTEAPAPLSLTVLAVLLVLVVYCTLLAFSRLGLTLLCLSRDNLPKGRTTSQGVFMQSAIFLLVTTSLSLHLPVLLPGYIGFAGVSGCDFTTYVTVGPDNTTSTCDITQLSSLIAEVEFARPVYNIILVGSTLAVAGVTLIFLIWHLARAQTAPSASGGPAFRSVQRQQDQNPLTRWYGGDDSP